jgi:hypothetical protein
MDTVTHFCNGHHIEKGRGDCMYRGPREFLPPPVPIESPQAAAELMYTDGCVQFPDLLNPQEVAEIRDWMARSGKPDAAYDMPKWCFNKQVYIDMQHDPMWLKLIDRSPAFETVELILGKQFVVVGGTIWVTGKGREMPMHVDRQAVSLPEEMLRDPRVRIPMFTCTLHYYLDDQVEEIGPTLVIPGSHLAGRAPNNESTWNGRTPKMVSVKAGGAVLFRHDLWHGATKNSSERRRYMIQVHYAEGSRRSAGDPITRPEFFSQEVLERITPRQRVLMGGTPKGIYD